MNHSNRRSPTPSKNRDRFCQKKSQGSTRDSNPARSDRNLLLYRLRYRSPLGKVSWTLGLDLARLVDTTGEDILHVEDDPSKNFFYISPYNPFSYSWFFSHKCLRRFAPWLERGIQVGSTTDQLSSHCLSNTPKISEQWGLSLRHKSLVKIAVVS